MKSVPAHKGPMRARSRGRGPRPRRGRAGPQRSGPPRRWPEGPPSSPPCLKVARPEQPESLLEFASGEIQRLVALASREVCHGQAAPADREHFPVSKVLGVFESQSIAGDRRLELPEAFLVGCESGPGGQHSRTVAGGRLQNDGPLEALNRSLSAAKLRLDVGENQDHFRDALPVRQFLGDREGFVQPGAGLVGAACAEQALAERFQHGEQDGLAGGLPASGEEAVGHVGRPFGLSEDRAAVPEPLQGGADRVGVRESPGQLEASLPARDRLREVPELPAGLALRQKAFAQHDAVSRFLAGAQARGERPKCRFGLVQNAKHAGLEQRGPRHPAAITGLLREPLRLPGVLEGTDRFAENHASVGGVVDGVPRHS